MARKLSSSVTFGWRLLLCFLCILVFLIADVIAADKVKSHKSPQQGAKKTSNFKLLILKIFAIIFGVIGVIVLLFFTRSKWCCIEACRGGGFLKNKIVKQVDAYMPGVRVNDDTGKTEYYEPTDEEMKALGSVLNVIKDMATMK